jgi:hypothetical protein
MQTAKEIEKPRQPRDKPQMVAIIEKVSAVTFPSWEDEGRCTVMKNRWTSQRSDWF